MNDREQMIELEQLRAENQRLEAEAAALRNALIDYRLSVSANNDPVFINGWLAATRAVAADHVRIALSTTAGQDLLAELDRLRKERRGVEELYGRHEPIEDMVAYVDALINDRDRLQDRVCELSDAIRAEAQAAWQRLDYRTNERLCKLIGEKTALEYESEDLEPETKGGA